MRFLHFATDDKFIPLIKGLFEEAFPGGNRFRLLDVKNSGHAFVRQDETTQIVREGYFSSSDLEKDLEDVDCLIMHSMLPPFANALPKVPEAVLVMWSGWGFDYSHIIEESLGELVFEKTLQLKNIARAKALFSADGIRRIWIRRKVIFGKKTKLQGVSKVKDALDSAMKRLDVFSVMPGEVEILKKSRANLRARHHMIQYYTTEDVLSAGESEITGVDILAGNSATPENNHVELFESLKKLDLEERRVIVPLSYGDQYYAEEVCRKGRKILGSSFCPLVEFMNLEEYSRIVASCSWVVMNHRRQQALGNISAALYKGAAVFLRDESPIFTFYRDMGAQIFSAQHIGEPSSLRTLRLSSEHVQLNREIVGAYWTRGRVVQSLKLLQNYSRGSSMRNSTDFV